MFSKTRIIGALIVIGTLVAACDNEPEQILAIDATGAVAGLVYIDRNGNAQLDTQVDAPAAEVAVELFVPGARTATARTTSNASGRYTFSDVPVGRYRVVIDTTTVGDSVRVALIDSSTVTVPAGDTAHVRVALGFPAVTVADFDTLQAGRRVILRGVALNGWVTFGDSTLHIADASGVLRALRVQQTDITAGDSLRLLGTVLVHDGVQTIGDASAFRVARAALTHTPDSVSTAEAATAKAGELDAHLVKITGARIINVQTLPSGEARVTVDDGTGVLDVLFEPTGDFARLPTIPVGALMDATGLLVPVAGRTSWQLKPRSTADITVRFQRVTVAEARALPTGRLVEVEGLALNSWVTFGDSTIHLVDPTGYIRSMRVVPSSVFAGDSVRFLGRTAMRDGQPVLAFVEPTVLLTNRTLPAPQPVSTVQAATAQNGALDAALVQLSNALVVDTATDPATGDYLMRVDDGSGLVTVVIESSLGLRLTPYVPGARLDITGLLVPVSGGATWFVRPRSQSDLVVR